MSLHSLTFNRVSFTYDTLAESLFSVLSFTLGRGWSGIVGRNGIGKSTLLELATGRLPPQSGIVTAPTPAIICPQRTDTPPDELADLLSFPDATAGELASILGLGADWPYRWESLSHGERKRAQIGVALWRTPEILAVDEPTNHLDREARRAVGDALETYDGIGLIVSHDRELLDRICVRSLFLSPYGPPVLRPGGVSQGMVEQRREDQEKRDARDRAVAAEQRLLKEATRRRNESSAADRKRSKKGLAWKDSDAREKIDHARVTGADGHAGKLLNQLRGRVEQAAATRESAAAPPRERHGVSVFGRRDQADSVLRSDAVRLSLGPGRYVDVPELVVRPFDRIGVVGPNGSGKSTLIRSLVHGWSKSDSRIYIPQEVSAEEGTRLVARVRELGTERLGRVLSTVSRLGSDPEQILSTAIPSPGETRKLMLALGLEGVPSLIVMDEPTNHLDLISIECIEEAISHYTGALLLVSHDAQFLRALVSIHWEIRRNPASGREEESFLLSVTGPGQDQSP